MQLTLLTKYLTYQLYHTLHLIFKIRLDGDIDDIHQFRIAIRRIQSLSKLYLNNSINPLTLKKVIKKTNKLRELDVLLSTINANNCPKSFKRLTLLRKNTYLSIFTDTFKHEIIQFIHHFYNDLCSLNPEGKSIPSIAESYYQKCVQDYHSLVENSTKKEFHHVRINFKIARYSLDFLHESSIADETKKINECKYYQDILGTIQDSYNQISLLKKLYNNYPTKKLHKLIKKRKKILQKQKKIKDTTLSERSPEC